MYMHVLLWYMHPYEKGIDWHTLIFDWDTPINASVSCTILTACFNYLYRECANKKKECANHIPYSISHLFLFFKTFDPANKYPQFDLGVVIANRFSLIGTWEKIARKHMFMAHLNQTWWCAS